MVNSCSSAVGVWKRNTRAQNCSCSTQMALKPLSFSSCHSNSEVAELHTVQCRVLFYPHPLSQCLNIGIKAALLCLNNECYFYSLNDESPLKSGLAVAALLSFLTHVLQLSGCLSCVCTEHTARPPPPLNFRSARRIQ